MAELVNVDLLLNNMLGGLGLGFRVRFRVRVSVRVRVNSFRDSFSVLLREQHYSMLKLFGTVTTS